MTRFQDRHGFRERGFGSTALVASAVVLLVLGFVTWRAADSVYFAPRAENAVEIETRLEQIANFEAILPRHFAVRDALRERGARTVGRDRDAIEHQLRVGVLAVAEGFGIESVVVNTGRPSGVSNPAGAERINAGLRRTFRSRADFQVVSGRVTGAGSFDQVVGLIAGMQAQPWLDRVDGFSISPSGRERSSFEVAIDFSVLLMPDLSPAEPAPLEIVSPSDAGRRAVQEVVDRAPFLDPLPPPAPKPQPKPAPKPVPEPTPREPAPPPPPPYGDWSLTAVIVRDDPSLSEAWMRNASENRVLVLRPGMDLLGLRLLAVAPAQADWDVSVALGTESAGASDDHRRIIRLRQTLKDAVEGR
jgi:hypothetical protein